MDPAEGADEERGSPAGSEAVASGVAHRAAGAVTESVPGAAPDAAVVVSGLRKRFPMRRSLRNTVLRPFQQEHLDVLTDVNFEVAPGELFGLLGPNGAGKTTLLKILSTLVLPDGGRVSVVGRDPESAPAEVRAVLTPVIADERSLDWRLSGPANLRLFAALYGVPPAERPEMIGRLIETVGLGHARDRMVGTYSSGMKQRLLIARALVSRPRVMLLDEPTRSLDPVSARDLRQMLRDVVIGELGCTIVLATHNPEEALNLCDRLAVLDRGHVVAVGSPQELVHLAEQERCRIVVRDDQEAMARAHLPEEYAASYTTAPVPTPGWIALEGTLPAGVDAAAELVASLTGAGVEVAELARPPLALADLIERIIARSPR